MRSTSSKRVRTPGYVLHGRTCAYMSSSFRSATFTDRKPPPTGVVIGPLSATPASRIAPRTSSGSGLPPCLSITSAPASRTSQSNSTPVASSTRRVASVSSGPVPSPGMRITRCATPRHSNGCRVTRRMTLAEAAAKADELARSGAAAERELAALRQEWGDELESAARSPDYRQRAVAFRAIGQFRFRQKLELLRRGLEDESPAVRGSALVSVQLLSKDSPGLVNSMRPLLHTIATADANQAVRRLAIVCLRNGSPQRETIVLLNGLAENDDQEPELRNAARSVAAELRKRGGPKSG